MRDNRGPVAAVETGAISLAAGDWCGAVNNIGVLCEWGPAAGLDRQLFVPRFSVCLAVYVITSALTVLHVI